MSARTDRRNRRACQIARRVPYDVETVYHVVEVCEEIDVEDPEEFLVRCSRVGLDPISTLSAARRAGAVGMPRRSRPIARIEIRLPGARLWLWAAWIWLTLAVVLLMGAIEARSLADVGLSLLLVAGAILAISVETRRLP